MHYHGIIRSFTAETKAKNMETTENKGTQLVHYGKLLKLKMAELDLKKQDVMDVLKIKSYETLKTRLDDAAFSYDQLRALMQKGWL